MNVFKSMKNRLSYIDFRGGDIFAAFSAAFIIASAIFALLGDFTDLSYVRQYPLGASVGIVAGAFFLLVVLSALFRTKKILGWTLLLSAVSFSLILVASYPQNVFFCIGLSCILVLVAKYVTDGDKLGIFSLRFGDLNSLFVTSLLVVAFTITVYAFTAAKYKAFYHSAFDFGIFCQMFESMAETGLPYTTIERSEYLSHFAVHFSPFFYLLLPGYFIFRSPLYLLFSQALGIALGAFPVRSICRKIGLSAGVSTAAAAIYLLFPTMANGCFYDFHENKFLSFLILWAVAFAVDKNALGTGVFCFLILTVKEDAFIYVIAICLWMFVTGRKRIFALVCAVLSLMWFFFACQMIQLSGGEIMTGRFANYTVSGNGGLLQAVRTCFIDIGYLFKEVFAGADTESFRELTYSGQKLEFVLWTAAPLLFTPFLRKRPSELVLLVPLLVINLMPKWMYQFDVDFQYTYGTCALIVASAIFFLAECKEGTRRFAVTAMLSVCIVFAAALFLPKAAYYSECYNGNREKYDETAKVLETIPDDASVTTYGYMAPHLWYIADLRTCPDYYSELVKTDYYVVDTRYEADGHTKKMFSAMGEDYSLISESGYVKIYRLKK